MDKPLNDSSQKKKKIQGNCLNNLYYEAFNSTGLKLGNQPNAMQMTNSKGM
jgi:hypothetical protein